MFENEFLKVTSLLDKGSDIIEILHKPRYVDFMWHAQPPLAFRNSKFIQTCSPSFGNFNDFYGGGWQDILPTVAGGSQTFKGAEFGMHGETALLPWDCTIEKNTAEEVTARLHVQLVRYPLEVDKWFTMRRGESGFTIRERVTNTSDLELEFSWLQHPTFGEPFLSPGSVIDVPAKTVLTSADRHPNSRLPKGTEGKSFKWPIVSGNNGEKVDLSRIPSKQCKTSDQAYLLDLKEGWYALTNPAMQLSFGLVWDVKIFPCVWFWQPLGGDLYSPWGNWGKTWTVALEPCTSWPLAKLEEYVKRGRVLKLKGKSRIETEFKVVVGEGLKKVNRINRDCSIE
jgi:hypothetical protein